MNVFDFGSPVLQAMSVPAIVVLVVLTALTMRSVALRERAMLFGRTRGDRVAERTGYENRWRNGGLPTA